MKIHHVGYLVKNKDKALKKFQNMGYHVSQNYVLDAYRKVFIAFMEKDGYLIELVSPFEKDSATGRLLKKYGNAPYHICYEVENFDKEVEAMQSNGFFMFDEPHEACAINNRKVCFMINPYIGMIELLEEEK